MTLLILGIILWWGGHLWRRFLPGLAASLGKAGYPISAVLILGSVVLIILGYRSAPFIEVWTPAPWLTHANNLLMLVAFYTYFATATRPGVAFVVGRLKHPQLTGFKIWAIAHLLVNGDLAAVLLFGSMLAWAVVEVILINRMGGNLSRDAAPIKSPWVHLALVLAVFTLVAGVHAWLGVYPFG
ncbi:MAG: NnrU family protein [Pseudomonadota bacterium]